jgi:hypothetical protein
MLHSIFSNSIFFQKCDYKTQVPVKLWHEKYAPKSGDVEESELRRKSNSYGDNDIFQTLVISESLSTPHRMSNDYWILNVENTAHDLMKGRAKYQNNP